MYNFSFLIQDFGGRLIILICAVSKNGVIGKNGQIPWNFKSDLEFFKRNTMKNIVVFGRKTFESITKPLNGRKIIVLTRNKDYFVEGAIIEHSCCNIVNNYLKSKNKCFIAGGSEIYNFFIDYAEKIYLTEIEKNFDGDATFPIEKLIDFRKESSKLVIEKGVTLNFLKLKRKRTLFKS